MGHQQYQAIGADAKFSVTKISDDRRADGSQIDLIELIHYNEIISRPLKFKKWNLQLHKI